MKSSPIRHWKAVFEKYSPSTNIKYCPVIPIHAKLRPVFYEDSFVITILWGLTTSEEYYYQNMIEVLSIDRNDDDKTNRLIRSHRTLAYWPNRLVNFHVLGSGSFGTVYKTEDRIDNYEYALKHISIDVEKNANFFSEILAILREKSSYLRLNNSPFVVRLYGAFQDDVFHTYWLLFEYCIGDLNLYLETIYSDMNIDETSIMDDFLARNVIDEIYEFFGEVGMDIESVGSIFSFELLAGLSYLAKRNLVHNDLKPDNVLVSYRGHLKIADLGLAQRVKWFDRYSATEMVKPSEILELKKVDEATHFTGNIRYTDPEALINNDMLVDKSEVYRNIVHEDFPIKNGTQDFLTDIFSVGVIMMELLFCGINFVTPDEISLNVAKRFGIDKSSELEVSFTQIQCIYDREMHNNYLMRIFNKQLTENNESIIRFLMTCLKPKSKRALDYTKEIEYRQFDKRLKSRCIDMEKIENLEYYRKRNITEYNVCSQEISAEILSLYNKTDYSEPMAADFNDLVDEIYPYVTVNRHTEVKFSGFQFIK